MTAVFEQNVPLFVTLHKAAALLSPCGVYPWACLCSCPGSGTRCDDAAFNTAVEHQGQNV